VLAGAALGTTWLGVWPFALFVIAVALLVAWEWGGIVRRAGADVIFAVTAVTVTGAVVLTAVGTPGLGFIAIVVGAILASLLGFGNHGHLASFGVLYSGLPAIALVWLRIGVQWGLAAVLFVFLVVWATDTGAYLAGRFFGGPRLLERVSPNKTWAGLAGGVVAAVLMGVALSSVLEGGRAPRMAITSLVLALVAQAGDLMESALKREHGVKDASNLIPGHGGFMDRVDGLIFAAIVAAMFGLIVNVHEPARALLLWN
jgi:phosphatidate cytidylyltransferase